MRFYPITLNYWIGLLLMGCWVSLSTPGLAQPSLTHPENRIRPLSVSEDHDVTVLLEAFRYATYQDLMQQAMQETAAVITTAFSDNLTLNGVTVHVLATHNGATLPLLRTQVSRADWQARPEVEFWAQSSGFSAPLLLGMATPGKLSTPHPPDAEDAEPSTPSAPRGRGSSRRRQILWMD